MRAHGSACVGALMLFASSAFGAEPGFYFGASGGQAQYDFDNPPIAFGIIPVGGFLPPVISFRPDPILNFPIAPFNPINAVSFAGAAQPLFWSPTDDDEAGSWTLTAGYRAGRHFAFEVSYLNLGTLEATDTFTLPPLAGGGTFTLHRELETSGPALAAMGILPVAESWDLFLRAGIFFADSKLSTSIGASSGSETFGSNATSLGAGAQFNWGAHWSARVEYQRFLEVGGDDDFDSDADVDLLSLGVLYRL
jgi:opacity protein-like surface antigen